jgi:four helix bundle protein
MPVRGYRDLNVWQKGMDLAEAAYRLSWRFPQSERFGLCSQSQLAAVSVPSNVAEGHSVGLRKPFQRHLRIARGSVAELETDMLLAERLNYISSQDSREFLARSEEVSKMLSGLLRSLDRER